MKQTFKMFLYLVYPDNCSHDINCKLTNFCQAIAHVRCIVLDHKVFKFLFSVVYSSACELRQNQIIYKSDLHDLCKFDTGNNLSPNKSLISV